MTAEETTSREHVKWARICVRGMGISIPATLSIGMGSLVYMCPVWVESGARVALRSKPTRYCDESRWREMMGKESAGKGYGTSEQRDRGVHWTIGVTRGGSTKEFFENDCQKPRFGNADSLHPKWPGQRSVKYVEKDRVNTKKGRWPLLDVIQRRRVLGFKSSRGRLGISKVLRSDMIHGRKGGDWTFNCLKG